MLPHLDTATALIPQTFARVIDQYLDWTIRNNEFIDFNSPVELVPESAGACGGQEEGGIISELYARPVTGVVIDRNWIRHPAPIGPLDGGITLKAGGSTFPGQVLGDVTITNNVITSDQGLETCILVAAGHGYTGSDPAYPPAPVPGAVRLVNNTCYGPITLAGAIVVGDQGGANQPYMQENIVLRNNLVGGINAGTRNVVTTYAPGSFAAAGNIWDPDAGFRWHATSGCIDLATWSALSGDTASQCKPVLRATDGLYSNGDPRPLAGDVHLHPVDACAQDSGVDASAITAVDLDGDARPQGGGWDAGADESAPTPLDQPPLRFSGAPAGILAAGTTALTLSLRTDQPSDCDLADQSDLTAAASPPRLSYSRAPCPCASATATIWRAASTAPSTRFSCGIGRCPAPRSPPCPEAEARVA